MDSKHVNQQKSIDFNRAAQLRILERAVIPTRGPGKTILKALDSYQRERPHSFPSVRELAHNTGLSKDTIRRGLRELRDFCHHGEAYPLVSITRRLRPDGSYTSNQYEIHWVRILDLCPPRDDDEELSSTGGGGSTVRGGTGTVRPGYSQDASSHHKRPSDRPVKRNPYGDGGLRETKEFWGRPHPLTNADLSDETTVAHLYKFTVGRGWLGRGEHDRTRFFALCRFVADKGREPGKYLTSLLKGRRWDVIRPEDLEWARAAIEALQQSGDLTQTLEQHRAEISRRLAAAKARTAEGAQ